VRHNVAKRFGERVKKLRLKKGMSQEALAAEAELDRAFVSGIERGIENPSLFTIQQIADALGISVEKLVKGL
jgi:transcriptional regulator with XRE-family HTH domain